MALTRPLINNLNTNIEVFNDTITVLHGNASVANADMGLLMNRAGGLVANVAIYWNESSQSFVTAFTSSDGMTYSNIAVTSYANLTIGNLFSINGNIYLNGATGTPGQYISATANGTAWANSSFNGGVISNTLYPSGNLTLNLGTTSAFWANTYTGNVILSNNILWANGAVFSSGTSSGSVGYSPSANVAIYANITPYTTNQTFYPVFSNIGTAGNSVTGVSSSLSYNPGTGTLSATNLSGTLSTAAQTNITSVGTLTSLAVGAVTSSGTIIAATINAATIGNSGAVLTGSTGTFTSWANVTGTATSTGTSTGALVVAGGAGIAGNLYVGGNISASNFLGNIFFGPTPTATYYTQAPLNLTNSLAGGIKTQLNLINTGGGAGAGAGIDFYTYTSVSGSTYPEARIAVVDDGNYSGYITFQTKIPGNTGANALAERLKIDSAGNLVISTTTTSTSTTTGALVVAGGAGIAGALYTGSVATATITATTINAATIGNTSANVVGIGTYLTALSAASISGTNSTANVGLYEQVQNYTTNQTFYPTFSNTSTSLANTTVGVNSSLTYNPATGALTATSFTGTISTASQPNITTLAGLTSFGTAGVTTTAQGNLSIAGNLVVTGNNISLGATTLSITDPIININTPQDLTPLTVPTTSDIGLKFHYYDTADSAGFAGRTVADGYFTYWAKGTDTANVFVGTQLGTFKGGAAWFNNTTAATGTTSSTAGALYVAGGAGIAGNLYVGNLNSGSGSITTTGTVSATTLVGTLSATNVSGTVATANVALYANTTNYTTNQTFYPMFSNLSTSGNTVYGVSNNLSFNPNTGNLIANIVTTTGNLIIGGNTVQNSKTFFNFSGDEQQISLDTSIMRTGSWSVTASGSLYTLAGEPLMWYWIHNCAIDPATGNFLARDDFGPVTVWALTESMLIKTWISPPDQTLSVPTSWTLTGNQDTNNGLFTTGGMSANSLKLTQVATPAAASGTGSATGGSLAAGNYYVRVVGIDVNAQSTLPSAESTVVTTTGSTSSIAYIIPATVGVNSYRIYVTQTSGTYTSGYFTFNPDYLTNYFTLTTLSGTTAGSLPSINNTGGVNITGNLTVLNTGGTNNSISGNVGINTATPDTELTILRSPQTVSYSIAGVNAASGTDLHIAGADGATPTRITQDTFGTGSYIAFTGRAGRGTAASPAQSLSGDTLTQFTGRGFSSGSQGFGVNSTGRVDIVAAENLTDTSRATNVVVYATATGAITPTAVATFSSNAVTTTASVLVPYGQSNAPVDISRISLAHALIA